MLNFKQPFRPNTIYGANSVETLPEYVYGENIMFVYGGGSIKHTGLYDKICDMLGAYTLLEVGGITSNPKLTLIRTAIEKGKAANIDQIIAVGGGSVIDAAKAIAVGIKTEVDIWQVYQNPTLVKEAVDILSVVTNVATGSETNDISVIVNDDINLKRSIKSPYIYPKVAIMDPLLTLTVNEYTTRYGLIDCFSHLLEQYFNTASNKLIDDQIVAYMRNIIELAPNLLNDLTNPELRDAHMYLSYVAYNSDIRNIVGGDFACHGLDYGLASVFDTTHGAGLAIITPNWMEYVTEHKPVKIASFSRGVFNIKEEDDYLAAKAGTVKLNQWLTSLKAAKRYTDINVIITEQQLDEMIAKAKVSYPLGNYYKLDEKAIKTIYEMGN